MVTRVKPFGNSCNIPLERLILGSMKRVLQIAVVLVLCSGTAWTQGPALQGLFDPEVFRSSVDVRSSLATLTRAVDDPVEWERLTNRVLLLDGVAASLAVYVDEADEYYAEIELITGAWHGVERVEVFRAWVVLDDPLFSGRLAERAPRDPDPELILRNDRILVAARILDRFTEPDGTVVPVLGAFEIRPMR